MAESAGNDGRTRPPPPPGSKPRRAATPPPIPPSGKAQGGLAGEEESLITQEGPQISPAELAQGADSDPSDAGSSDDVQALLELLAAEADALEAGGGEASRADLNLRLAMAHWDVGGADASGGLDRCVRYLDGAEQHPLAPRWSYLLALSEHRSDLLENAGAMLAKATPESWPDGDCRLAMRDLAEAWLYRFNDAPRAVEAARTGLEQAGDIATSELDAMLHLGLAAAGQWGALAEVLAERATTGLGANAQQATGGALRFASEAIHLYYDRLEDRAAAAELLGELLAAIGGRDEANGSAVEPGPATQAEAYLVDRALELAAACDPAQVPQLDLARLLQRRLQLLEAYPEAAVDASAVRFFLAETLFQQAAPELDTADALLAELAVPSDTGSSWGPRLAAMVQVRVALQSGRWDVAATALLALAEQPGAGDLATCYDRRAAELLGARGDDAVRAREIWRRLAEADPSDSQATRSIEYGLLAGDSDPLLVYLDDMASLAETDARSGALRRAAAVAESRGQDPALALERRQASLTEVQRIADLEDVARLHRKAGQGAQVAGLYLVIADKTKSPRVASALRCGAGVLLLACQQPAEAEQAFTAAAKEAPNDPMARAALASVYRTTARWPELAAVLTELAKLLSDDSLRLRVLRELGHVSAVQLADTSTAAHHLEAALELDPDDVASLHELARLCDQLERWEQSVELRQRAAELVDIPEERCALLLEVARIEQTHRQDDDAALLAYESVLDANPASLEALTSVAEIHRRNQRPLELLHTLRSSLELTDEPELQLALQLEIADCCERGDDSAEAIEALLAALLIEPDNETALEGVAKLATAAQRWDLLADAYRAAPADAANLAVLAEAHERAEAWGELLETRREQISCAANPAERARLAASAAQVAERRLDDVAAAIELNEIALTADPGLAEVQQTQVRLLEHNNKWPELAMALERELTTVPGTDIERRHALFTRLGELRHDKLNKAGDAALAYEGALELEPGNLATLEVLERLYETLARDQDLLRILELRAAAVADEQLQAQLFGRVAEVKAGRNDIDGAVAAYRAAFGADPTNRNTFTAMEKLTYKNERWLDAMGLYDDAIELVESGKSRAYRLGDLYARRGQVQLQYLGQPDEAAASYLRVVELDPDNDTAVKFLESIFSQQGDWPGLISAYETRAQLARDDERRLESLRRAARVAAAKLKDAAEAARLYEVILAVDGSDQEALDALERYHERSEDWDKLVEVLKVRLSSAPAGDDAVGMLKRIAQICEEGMRDESRAIENYLRILEIAPGNRGALEALGRIYESTEQWSEFIDVTRRQIRVTTDRNMKALLYFKCGSVMEAKFGKPEDAIRYYDAAIKTSPSCLPAVHGLRDLHRRREDWPRVIQTLELEVKLWQDDKERAGVFAQIGQIYSRRLGQPERALHYFESALAVDPECLPANRALFDQYFDAEEWARAQPLAQALAQKAMREGDPSQRSAFYLKRGIVSSHTGDSRGAAESMIIALEIKPDNLEALDELGRLARIAPEAYEFPATYRELEKLYKKRDDSQPFQARVLVAQAIMKERDGDLDAAEGLYKEALERAVDDYTILSALVTLHINMRRWIHAADVIRRFLDRDSRSGDEVRVRALMQLAFIHGEGEMDAQQAASVLREVIRVDPQHQEAHYRLAQEMYLLSRFEEAEASVNRCIELAAAPGAEISPETLARYYYYLGRIKEASGDARSAASQFRRAAEYDPGYAPPALALAKRAVENGDQRTAESLLINAAHAAMEKGGAEAAVPLQRGLARILLASGDRAAAIEAYRGILAVEADGAEDHVALAEIYAMEDLPKALQELNRVLASDLRHAPAYRMLAQLYARVGDGDRAVRVLSIMDLLGYAEEQDKGSLAQGRAGLTHQPLRGHLEDDMRKQFLLRADANAPVGQLFHSIAAEVTTLFPQPGMGENLTPIQTLDDSALKVAITDCCRLFGVEPEVYVGENVPGAVAITSHPRRIVTFDRSLLTESDASRRFLLGRAFESIRGGYSVLLHLTNRERLELSGLLTSLLLPESEQMPPTKEFMSTLNKRALRVIERYNGQANEVDAESWFDGMISSANRAGLFACDDFTAAVEMLSRLGGEAVAVTSDGALALGAVVGGEDLVRFYLEDDYQRMRQALASAPQQPGGQA